MALDLTLFRALRLVHDTDLQRAWDNLEEVRGTATAQTETEVHAPLAVADFVRGTVNGKGELFKRYVLADDDGARLAIVAEDIRGGSSVEPGYGVELQQSIGVTAGAEQDMAGHNWRLAADAEGNPTRGYFEMTAEGGVPGPDLVLDPDGRAGIELTDPAVALDVGGSLNVVDDYMVNGVVVEDWTVVGGTPDTATWDGGATPPGKALLSGAWRTSYHVLTAVHAASTGNLILTDAQTVDGVSVGDTDSVLAKNQTNPAENGPYTVVHPGNWIRRADADTWTKLVGAAVSVSGGTAHGGENWAARILPGGTLDTLGNDIPWEEDTRADFGAPIAVVSTDEAVNVDTDLMQGSPWVTPRRLITDGSYSTGDTTIGAPGTLAITEAEWDARAVVTVIPDPADVGEDIEVKLKNGAGTVLDSVTISAKAVTVGIVTNAVPETVLLHSPYSAAGADTLEVTVACAGGTGGTAIAFIRAKFLGV